MAASSGPSPTGFNLYDLLTRVTPGLFLLTVMITTYVDTEVLLNISYSNLFAGLALFAGFLTGEIIDSFRMQWFAAPKPFRRLLYEERKSSDWWTNINNRITDHHFLFTGILSTSLVNRDPVWPVFIQHLRVDENLKGSNKIYLLLTVEIDSQLTTMTRRYQTTTIFVQNMRVAIPVAVLWVLVSFLIGGDTIQGLRVAVLIFVGPIGFLLYLFNAVENTYVRLLLHQIDVMWPEQSKPDTSQRKLDEF